MSERVGSQSELQQVRWEGRYMHCLSDVGRNFPPRRFAISKALVLLGPTVMCKLSQF